MTVYSNHIKRGQIIKQLKLKIGKLVLIDMYSNSKPSVLSAKKDQFRRQIRAEQLHNYMKKRRMQLYQFQQYEVLRDLFNSLFNEDKDLNPTKQAQRIENLKKIIEFINHGNTSAIVALAELLLNKSVTISMIYSLQIHKEQTQNTSNQNSAEHTNDIMQVIKFPQVQNQGWLAFIRVLLTLDYCTEKMILYCLKTIMKQKAFKSIDLALEIIFYVLIDKKLFKLEELMKLMISQNSLREKGNQQSMPEKLFNSLMILSLDTFSRYKQFPSIGYYSTKILCKFFSTSQVLDFMLKRVSLKTFCDYIKQKFNMRSIWSRKKALTMLNDFLLELRQFNNYPLNVLFVTVASYVKYIVKQITKNSYQILQSSKGIRGFKKQGGLQEINYEQNFKFLQEGVFLVQILLQDYSFTHNDVAITNELLFTFQLENFLIYIYETYAIQVIEANKKIKYFEDENTQSEQAGLTFEEMCKSLLIQKVIKISEALIENFFKMSQKIRNNEIQCSEQTISSFICVRNLVLSRLKPSQLGYLVERQEKRYSIDLNYI